VNAVSCSATPDAATAYIPKRGHKLLTGPRRHGSSKKTFKNSSAVPLRRRSQS